MSKEPLDLEQFEGHTKNWQRNGLKIFGLDGSVCVCTMDNAYFTKGKVANLNRIESLANFRLIEAAPSLLAENKNIRIENTTLLAEVKALRAQVEKMMCYDCPPEDYPTHKTRCNSCPRRQALKGTPHDK